MQPLVRALRQCCVIGLGLLLQRFYYDTMPAMPSTPSRRALIYCRISQDRTGAGLGVDRQEVDCRALADRLKCTVVRVHTDNDVSAYKGKRRGYQALLEDLRSGAADTLLAWHSDRLHRQPRELEDFIDLINSKAIEVHFVQSGELDLSTPSGRLHARIMGVVDRHESEHKSERIARARLQRAQAGKWGGGSRPFGWESDGVTPVPAEIGAIRRAYDMLLHGGSLRGVMKMLNEAGLLTPKKGIEWQSVTTKTMLMRSRNAGRITHRGVTLGKGIWDAVVSEDEWRAVCDILTKPERKTSPGTTPRWFGSLIYKCGVCGDGLYVSISGSPGRPSYRCRSHMRGGKTHVVRKAENLDWYIESALLARLKSPHYTEAFEDEPVVQVDIPVLRRRLALLEQSGRSMATKLGEEDISEEEYDAFIGPNRAKIRAAQAEIAAATVTSPGRDLAKAENVDEKWAGYDLDQKRAVLRDVMTVTVHRSGSRGGRFDPSSIAVEWL